MELGGRKAVDYNARINYLIQKDNSYINFYTMITKKQIKF